MFNELIQQFISSLQLSISQMQTNENGEVEMNPDEFGMTMVAVAMGQAMTLGTTPEQLKQVVARCLHEKVEDEKPVPKIILS